jgi:hypothetical protein
MVLKTGMRFLFPRSGMAFARKKGKSRGQPLEGGAMKINFIPVREQMVREIERCISRSMLETLTSFCNSCIYKIYQRAIPECCTCQVQQGASAIMKKRNRPSVEDEDLLGFC